MRPSGQRLLLTLALAAASLMLLELLPAQVVHNRQSATRVAPADATELLAQMLFNPQEPSPVEIFRELLDKTPEERAEFLADRPVEIRKRILAKVREYESMGAEQRELRLRVTELRWYFWPLLDTPATNRATWLLRIPIEERKLVEDRLKHWDTLTVEVRQELLDNEATLRYFTELAGSTEEGKSNIVRNLSPERRRKLEAGIRQIQRMPEQQRQKMMARFDQFFELTPSERSRALGTLSETERRQIEKTLGAFERLAPNVRDQCIQSFEKFVKMSLAERQQFLKGVERWKLMSPDDRQDWRDLVASMAIQPPLPSEAGPPDPPLPGSP